MAPKTYFFAVLFFGCFAIKACSQTNSSKMPATVFVGSTPCDSTIKTLLQIPASTACDFIRWEMTLTGDHEDSAFVLNITYGESQPNTLGFKGGGEQRSFKGTYAVFKNNKGTSKGEVLQLKAESPATAISLVKLNDQLLHLLTPSGKLMTGNGGWSYTLNRKGKINTTTPLPVLVARSNNMNDQSPQVIFEGRSPCQNFADEHQMKVSPSCFKLKWRLVLNRDPASYEPTTYTIRKVVDNVPRDVSGKWTITRGIQGNPDALIYHLDPDKPKESISLLVGDENVLFFLNQEHELYVGNSDFSFTLNRKQ